ncbi:MAG: hypothetical protein V4501_01865 [Pseudomonadota bacterium]
MPNPKSAGLKELVAQLREIGDLYLENKPYDASEKNIFIAEALSIISIPKFNYGTPDEIVLLEKLDDLFISDLFSDEVEPADEKLVAQVREVLTNYQSFNDLDLKLDSYSSLGFLIAALKNEIIELYKKYTYEQVPDPTQAFKKVVAQAFYGLIIPEQPYVGLTKLNNKLLMRTKKNANDQILDDDELVAKVNAGEITGVVKIQVLNLLLNEQDFDLSKIAVTKNNVAVKINSNCYLPESADEFRMFAEEDIENLYYDDEPLWSEGYFSIPPNVNIREVDETILRLMILTPDLISRFLSDYSTSPEVNEQIKHSFELLLASFNGAAMSNASFQQFLISPAAEEGFNKIVKVWQHKETNTGTPFISEKLKTNLTENFVRLKTMASKLVAGESFESVNAQSKKPLPEIKKKTSPSALASFRTLFNKGPVVQDTPPPAKPTGKLGPIINPKKR